MAQLELAVWMAFWVISWSTLLTIALPKIARLTQNNPALPPVTTLNHTHISWQWW